MEREYGVAVVGGGTAGLVAAIAAARMGVDTVLVEQRGYVGGLAVSGIAFGGFKDRHGHQVITGLPKEIVDRAIALGGLGCISTTAEDRWIASLISVDPEILKYVGQEMLVEAGCKLLFYTTCVGVIKDGNRLTGIQVFNRAGCHKIWADALIDATGDGEIVALAGAEFERGDDSGRHQATTSIFRVGNVDIPKFVAFMNQVLNTENRHQWSILDAPLRSGWKYWLPWRDSGRDDLPDTCTFYFHGNTGDVFVNSTHKDVTNALDPDEISLATADLRKQAHRVFAYLKENVPGFKESYLSYVNDVGIRDSRRIRGDYVLTYEDIMNGVHFPDSVAMGAYPPDVHRHFGEVSINKDENTWYEIPYRCLLPSGLESLIVVGRCISTTFMAQAAIRGVGPCMSTGEAGGTAAALAVQNGITPRDLPAVGLREVLCRRGPRKEVSAIHLSYIANT